MASNFNLFDFSKLGGVSSIVKSPVQTKGATGGGVMPPTVTAKPLPQTPVQKTVATTIPQTSSGTDIIKSFYDNTQIPNEDKKLVSDAIAKGMDRKQAENYLTTQYSKKDLLVKPESGLGDYFKGLAGRVGEGLAQVPSDIINVGAEAVGSDFRTQPISQSIFGVTPSSEKGVIGRSADILKNTYGGLEDIARANDEQSRIESGLQTGLKGIHGAVNVLGEVFMSGLSTVTPDIAKEKLSGYIQDIAKTEGGQNAISAAQQIKSDYQEFAKNNPRAARNLTAIAEVADTALQFWGVGKGKQLTEKGLETTGKIALKTGETLGKTGEVIGDIGKKTGEVATAPFKSIINTAKKYTGTPEEVSGIQSAIKPKQRVKNGVLQRGQEQINNEIKLTNGLIREAGEAPTDLATYKDSIKKQMENVGSEINRLTGQDLTIDLTPTAGKIRQIANSKEVQLLDPSESAKLLRMADDIEANGRLSLQDAEAMNQFINDTLKSTTTSASEAYKRGLQTLVGDIRQGLDDTISNIPGQFKDIKKTYGALRNVYGDVIAREIVYNRQNMGGLIDSIGAIEGSGNVISGLTKIITGSPGAGIADIGKGITQNAVGRFIKGKNDPNNIIRSIFQKGGEKRTIPNIEAKPKAKQLLLGPATGKPTSAKVSNVKPISATESGKLSKTNTALSGKVGERPGLIKPTPKPTTNAPKPLIKKSPVGDVQPKSSKPSMLDLSKNKKGFISPKAIGESVGIGKVPDGIMKSPLFNKSKPFGLTTEEGDIISKYSNWGYKGSTDSIALDKAIEKIPNSSGLTFRGDNIKDFSKFEKGKVISFGKPLSSSYKSDIADNFKGNTVFTIDGVTGKDISMLSDVSGEGEVLFGSKSKFKVKSVYKSKDGITNIELSQVE